MAESPKPNQNLSDTVRELAQSGQFKAPRADEAKAMGSAGAPLEPKDPEKVKKTEALFKRLASHFNLTPAKGSEIGYPKRPKDLPSPVREQLETRIRHWKQQKLTKCGEPKCFHPLVAKKIAEFDNAPIILPDADGVGQVIAAECTYDPRHMGGLQWIPVRTDDDEG